MEVAVGGEGGPAVVAGGPAVGGGGEGGMEAGNNVAGGPAVVTGGEGGDGGPPAVVAGGPPNGAGGLLGRANTFLRAKHGRICLVKSAFASGYIASAITIIYSTPGNHMQTGVSILVATLVLSTIWAGISIWRQRDEDVEPAMEDANNQV